MSHVGSSNKVYGPRMRTLCLLALCLLMGCRSLDLQSNWGEKTHIAGEPGWYGPLTPLRQKEALVGVQNDDAFLHFRLVTTDPEFQRRITREGLTIWFDRDGGENKGFGIHYPLPARMNGFPGDMGEDP